MVEMGTGECMDGAPMLWIGNSVMFLSGCDECMELLRAEGFDVSVAPTPVPT